MNREAVFVILTMIPLFFVLITNQRWISERISEPLALPERTEASQPIHPVPAANSTTHEEYETDAPAVEHTLPVYEDSASYEAVLTPVDEYWLEESEGNTGETLAQKD